MTMPLFGNNNTIVSQMKSCFKMCLCECLYRERESEERKAEERTSKNKINKKKEMLEFLAN